MKAKRLILFTPPPRQQNSIGNVEREKEDERELSKKHADGGTCIAVIAFVHVNE